MKLRLKLALLSSIGLALVGGCSSFVDQFARQTFSDTDVYQQNIEFEVNGKDYDGIAVVPKADKYEIEAKFPEGDFVKIQSCHGTEKREKEGGKVSFTYRPKPIELERYCPLEFYAIEQKRGRRGYGILLFKSSAYSLVGELDCNWQTTRDSDLACQAQVGTIQEIRFLEPVYGVSESESCKLDGSGQVWQMPVSMGRCVYKFGAISDKSRRTRLYMLGYKKFVIEE